MATKGVGGNGGGEVDAVNLPSVKSIRIEESTILQKWYFSGIDYDRRKILC